MLTEYQYDGELREQQSLKKKYISILNIKLTVLIVLFICNSIFTFWHSKQMVGCRFKANCPIVGLGPVGKVPSVGIFLRDPSPYLREFRKKPLKTPNG